MTGAHESEPGRSHLPPESLARHLVQQARLREGGRCRDAALLARRTYPGPLGEFIHRELIAHADLGFFFFCDGLVPRLIDALLAAEPDRHDQ